MKIPVPLPVGHDADDRPLPPLSADTNTDKADFGFDLDEAQRTTLLTAGNPQVKSHTRENHTSINKVHKGKPMGAKRKEYLMWLIKIVVLKHRRPVAYKDMEAICEAFNRKWRYEWEFDTGSYLAHGYHDLDCVALKDRKGDDSRVAHFKEIVAAHEH